MMSDERRNLQKITPFLWFKVPLDEPIAYYRSVFENMHVDSVSPASAEFEIEGQRFKALHGGPQHDFNEASRSSSSARTRTRSTTTGSVSPPMAAPRACAGG